MHAAGLLAPDRVAVERDVDGARPADDLAVVVDRLAADGGELLLDRDRRAGVERRDDADLGTVRDALLGLRELLLRVVERVRDRRLDASGLEGLGERRLVELLPADRRLGVRQQDADVNRRRRSWRLSRKRHRPSLPRQHAHEPDDHDHKLSSRCSPPVCADSRCAARLQRHAVRSSLRSKCHWATFDRSRTSFADHPTAPWHRRRAGGQQTSRGELLSKVDSPGLRRRQATARPGRSGA